MQKKKIIEFRNIVKNFDGESSLSRSAKRVGYGVSRCKELCVKITPELQPEQSRVRRRCRVKARILMDMWIRLVLYFSHFIVKWAFLLYWRKDERDLH